MIPKHFNATVTREGSSTMYELPRVVKSQQVKQHDELFDFLNPKIKKEPNLSCEFDGKWFVYIRRFKSGNVIYKLNTKRKYERKKV